jgi:hypothetical protein
VNVISANDLLPFETMCRRAGIGLRYGHELAKVAKCPPPIKGVPRPLAIAWLESRGADTSTLPPGDLIRIAELCVIAGLARTNYYAAVRKGKAPRQLKGVLKTQAEEWLRAWKAVGAAKQRLDALAAATAAPPREA